MPFDDASKQTEKDNIALCNTATDLFWGFFFDFHADDISADMDKRLPDVKKKLLDLEAKNNELRLKEEPAQANECLLKSAVKAKDGKWFGGKKAGKRSYMKELLCHKRYKRMIAESAVRLDKAPEATRGKTLIDIEDNAHDMDAIRLKTGEKAFDVLDDAARNTYYDNGYPYSGDDVNFFESTESREYAWEEWFDDVNVLYVGHATKDEDGHIEYREVVLDCTADEVLEGFRRTYPDLRWEDDYGSEDPLHAGYEARERKK